jgi:hypothetical protein
MAHIFISYRRADWPIAAWLSRQLRAKFGKKSVWRDVEDFHGGDPWSSELKQRINSSRAVLVVIGKDWNPGDVLVREVEQALEEEKAIPVVIEGTDLEKLQLPSKIARLAERHYRKVTDDYFEHDVDRIVLDIKSKGVSLSVLTKLPWLILVGLVIAVALALEPFITFGGSVNAMPAILGSAALIVVMAALLVYFRRRSE